VAPDPEVTGPVRCLPAKEGTQSDPRLGAHGPGPVVHRTGASTVSQILVFFARKGQPLWAFWDHKNTPMAHLFSTQALWCTRSQPDLAFFCKEGATAMGFLGL
jgi:hypothetical protein